MRLPHSESDAATAQTGGYSDGSGCLTHRIGQFTALSVICHLARRFVQSFPNGLNYFLPGELGGFVGHLAYALGEQNSTPSTTKNDGKYVGGRVGYAAGPFAIAVATGTTQYSTGDFKQTNLGVTFRVGPAKLMLLAGENKVGVTKTSVVTLGTQFTVGNGEIRAAYTQLDAKGVASDAHQIALGYVHDLSKRTALYATASQIDNKGAGKTFNLGVSPVTAGGNSTGYEIGLRHNF